MKKRLTIVRYLKMLYYRVIRLRDDPSTLAQSFAFGSFIGVIPLMPIQTIILIPLTIVLRLNTFVALIAASLISNPLTYIPQYYLCWWVGNHILPDWVQWQHLKGTLLRIHEQDIIDSLYSLTHLGFKTFTVLLTGGFLLGLLLTPLSYCFSLIIIRSIKNARSKRHRLN